MYVGSCSEQPKNEEEAMNEMTYNEAIEGMDSRHWSGTGKGIVRSQERLEQMIIGWMAGLISILIIQTTNTPLNIHT